MLARPLILIYQHKLALKSRYGGWERGERTFMKKETTVIVPIRKGSTRVKGKNLKPFYDLGSKPGGGGSLLHWKLEQLLHVFPEKNVIVSTDWDSATEVANSYGVVTDDRPDWLAEADSPFEELIKHCALLVETQYMAWSPATSPFMGAAEISQMLESFSSLREREKQDGMVAASKEPSYFFMGGQPLNFPVGKGHVRTQDIQPLTILNWAFSIRATKQVLADSYMFSESPHIFEIDRFANLDVNDELDFEMAKNLVELYRQRAKND